MASKFLATEQAVAKYFKRSLHDDADYGSLQQSASNQKNHKVVFVQQHPAKNNLNILFS